jgi:hypothetical protein
MYCRRFMQHRTSLSLSATVPFMRRPIGSIVVVILLLVCSACSSVSVGADNRYGRTQGAAVLNFPLGIKSKTAVSDVQMVTLVTGQVISVHDGDSITVVGDGYTEKSA